MEMRIDRIGLDLGTAAQAEAHAAAAAELGPDMVRLRFGLDGHVEPDTAFLADAGRAVDALRARGLRILAVVDSDLTVAPEGMGAFLDRQPGPLARAWTDEMASNAGRLAASIGDRVAAWEILPLPNVGSPPRIAAGRWASLLGALADAIRGAAPGASIVSGALASSDTDDGMDYLRAAWRAATSGGLWPEGRPPFDGLGLRLSLLPDGGDSEAALAATLRERASRVIETLSELSGDPSGSPDLLVTGLSWDASRIGEELQARNVWTALNALTELPALRTAVWTGLTDANPHGGGATGLCRGSETGPEARRYAWRAFRDFATYARQISPSPLAEAMRDAAREAEDAAAAQALAPAAPASVDASLRDEPTLEQPPDPALAAEPPSEDLATPDLSDAGLGTMAEAEVETAAARSDVGAADASAPLEPGSEARAAEPEAAETDADQAMDADQAADADHAAASEHGLARRLAAGAAAIAALAGRGRSAGDEPTDPTPAIDSEGAEPEPALPDRDAPDTSEEDAPAEPRSEAPGAAAPEPIALPEAEAEAQLSFHIPNAEEVLRGRGFEGERLATLLAAVKRRYGGHEWLPAGDYTITVPGSLLAEAPAGAGEADGGATDRDPVIDEPDAGTAIADGGEASGQAGGAGQDQDAQGAGAAAGGALAEPGSEPQPIEVVAASTGLTNQQVISALYRAGGGTWTLFERSGLSLRELAAARTQPYRGPELSSLAGLGDAERQALQHEIEDLAGTGPA